MDVVISILNGVSRFIEYLALIYFSISSLYVFLFAIAGKFYKRRKGLAIASHGKFAIFIPAFKEDAIIFDVSQKALSQEYPVDCFDIIVIADSLQEETLKSLKTLPIKLVEVSFEHSTKSKALNQAILELENSYDYALILDADNIMENQFLKKLNHSFHRGYKVIQGHRKAKNLNTSFAILDAASEEINNHIFRTGHRVLGLSSGLIGSGMAFDYNLFKTVMKPIKAVGGFDKELEFELAKSNIVIEYLQNAVVYDEKIQKGKDFSVQRKRWLATQFIYLRRYFMQSCKQLILNQNINLFDKAFQLIIPPRLLLLGMVFLITNVCVFVDFEWSTWDSSLTIIWVVNLIVLVTTFCISLPKSFYNRRTLKSLLSIPNAFFRMFLLLFHLKGANKRFIHTSHTVIKN